MLWMLEMCQHAQRVCMVLFAFVLERIMKKLSQKLYYFEPNLGYIVIFLIILIIEKIIQIIF